jgi:hypothetical protein
MRRQGEICGKSCSKPEGQEVSGKNRLRMFAGCGGKGRYVVRHVQPPKGRAFQEKIDMVYSFLTKKARAWTNVFMGESWISLS